MSARASRAPAPLSTENRAPAILAAALEVEDAERRAEIPVRLRLEVERARLAVAPDFDVVRGALADRHARVRQIRQRRAAPASRWCSIDVELDAELLDLLRARAVRLLNRRRVVALPLGARDLVARRVLLRASALRAPE